MSSIPSQRPSPKQKGRRRGGNGSIKYTPSVVSKEKEHWGRGSPIFMSYGRLNVSYGNFLLPYDVIW